MKKNTVMVAKGDLMSEEQRMTSMEIAQVTGKPHNDVLKAIRKMEEAWVKVQGGNFSLLQKIYELPNGGKKSTPFYSLTKTECLYVATKFNDEARARLVLRWETLEREQRQQTTAIRKLPVTDGDVLAEAERIVERQLKGNNRNADGCITTTDIAKAMGMTTKELNVLPPFSRICNPAASNIRIFNPYTARVSRAFRRICRSISGRLLPKGRKNPAASNICI
jgi:phage regulator Rha-like protein